GAAASADAGAWPATTALNTMPVNAEANAKQRSVLMGLSFLRASGQGRIDDPEGVLPANEVHIGDSEDALQLLGGDLHRTGRVGRAGRRLWKGRRRRGVKGHVAFHFLQRLVNVPIQHRDRAELLEERQRLRAVFRAPAPLRVHAPERNVGEYDDRRAVLQMGDVVLEPRQLPGSERAETARLQVEDVHQADEVRALLIEAVPAGAVGALAVALEILLAIVVEHVVFTGYEEHILGAGALENLIDRVELVRSRQVADVARVEHELWRDGKRVDLV